MTVLDVMIMLVTSARDLGVVLDSQLSLPAHVVALYRAGFFSPSTTMSSCSINENNCRQNSSPGVYLLPSRLLQLHAVRHVRRPFVEGSVHPERPARLVTGARRCDRITTVLRQLHWLPVRQRVEYKVACLVHHRQLVRYPHT